jgi:hypothetical protein
VGGNENDSEGGIGNCTVVVGCVDSGVDCVGSADNELRTYLATLLG